jgi:hypothetical protein
VHGRLRNDQNKTRKRSNWKSGGGKQRRAGGVEEVNLTDETAQCLPKVNSIDSDPAGSQT